MQKVVIVVTKGNAVVSVWTYTSSVNNVLAIERAVVLAVKGRSYGKRGAISPSRASRRSENSASR